MSGCVIIWVDTTTDVRNLKIKSLQPKSNVFDPKRRISLWVIKQGDKWFMVGVNYEL